MSDVIHRVIVELQARGNLGQKVSAQTKELQKMDRALARVGDSLLGFGGSIGSAFTGVVEKVAAVGAGLAAIGAAVGLKQVYDGVFTVNNQLEKTQISLAAIFNANGLAGSMQSGMQKAADIMVKIRKDAAALPGETEDLVNIFKMMAVPGSRMGMSIPQMEEISSKVMAAGATAGLQMDQVAREFGQLLGGRAGGHNILGAQLFGLTGDKAQEFNKLGDADRIKRLNAEFGKFAPSIATFGKSFDAQISTLRDNFKLFKIEATKPLFESVKRVFSNMNDWFGGTGAAQASAFAERIGVSLASAFEHGVSAIKDWTPPFLAFMHNAHAEFTKLWSTVSTLFGSLGIDFKGMLADPNTFTRLETIGKMYAGIKLAQTLPIGGIVKAAGGLGSAGGPVAIALFAGAALEAAGALHALSDATSPMHKEAVVAVSKLNAAFSTLVDTTMISVMPALEFLGVKGIEVLTLTVHALNGILHPFEAMGAVLDVLSGQFKLGATYLSAMNKVIDVLIQTTFPVLSVAMSIGKSNTASTDASMKAAGAPAYGYVEHDRRSGEGGKLRPPSPAPGTNIQKVEIVVSSNQDPSRIARLTMQEIQNLQRNPKIARTVPNYSR